MYGPESPDGGGLAGGSRQAPRWRRIFSTTCGSSITATTDQRTDLTFTISWPSGEEGQRHGTVLELFAP